jgi:hypothetical protein
VCDVVGLDRSWLFVPDGTGADLVVLTAAAVGTRRIVALGGVDVQIRDANGHPA